MRIEETYVSKQQHPEKAGNCGCDRGDHEYSLDGSKRGNICITCDLRKIAAGDDTKDCMADTMHRLRHWLLCIHGFSRE